MKIIYESVSGIDRIELIIIDDVTRTGSKFRSLITTSPMIASYVRELTLYFRLPRNLVVPPRLSSRNNGFSLYGILPQLKNLQKVACPPSLYDHPWSWFEERIQSFLLDMVPNVEELDLSIFKDFPIGAFSACRKLRSLRAHSLKWDPDITNQPSINKVELDSLDIGQKAILTSSTTTCFSSPFSPFDIMHLSSL
ncbi:hypothetical protein CPB84DRAFT_1851099 [Gymnopilus junonius]|uniref:Uncharacterized protein n=1 Tax=Gymnopilus junonius TaxID=109634 RepID=A0A9P5NEI4_GYMJU|nr:hypothetical protein CPB84DRAFT_1851099 [Gymnopilus junonius]